MSLIHRNLFFALDILTFASILMKRVGGAGIFILPENTEKYLNPEAFYRHKGFNLVGNQIASAAKIFYF